MVSLSMHTEVILVAHDGPAPKFLNHSFNVSEQNVAYILSDTASRLHNSSVVLCKSGSFYSKFPYNLGCFSFE